AILCLDLATGAERWAWKEDGPSYASPILASLGGGQLVAQTQNHVVGLKASTGEFLWKLPFRTDYDQNSVTPLFAFSRLYVSGLGKGTHAQLVRGKEVELLWRNHDHSFYMSTPVPVGNSLIGLQHERKGSLVCLDAATGQKRWEGPPRQGENASVIAAGSVLLVVTEPGKLVVAAASEERYQELARYPLSESPIWAHPALVGRALYVKDADTLRRFDLPE
ncbi:MAG TPA: PQQ-binding-like beta-propeller repeat protein, partial [Planctomycetia bacterium]|nr:PQQ-binding-like beta-propeller repeat protein [Planctomycetia bacterium]